MRSPRKADNKKQAPQSNTVDCDAVCTPDAIRDVPVRSPRKADNKKTSTAIKYG